MNVLKKGEETELTKGLDHEETIEKEAAFSWDGANLVVRFPKDLATYLNINKENRFEKNLKFKIIDNEGEVTQTFEVVDRIKPKRKTNGKEKNKK